MSENPIPAPTDPRLPGQEPGADVRPLPGPDLPNFEVEAGPDLIAPPNGTPAGSDAVTGGDTEPIPGIA